MVRRNFKIVVVAAAFALGACLVSPAVAAPVQPIDIAKGVAPEIDQVSFWGLPYPYGYAWRSNPCVRHVRVHSRGGYVRWRRVWVCD